MNKKISFKLDKINDSQIKVLVKISHECGWVHDLRLNMENSMTSLSFPIQHKENVDGFSYFESVVDIPTAANYRYYFSYFVDGKRYFIKNGDDNTSLQKNEMFKMSHNFEVPDWAKGKVMYHIFVDRFYKGREKELEKLPRRIVHSDWNDEMIIGPDKNGIWNNDFYGGDLKGIEKKLDYIQSLGVSILYLSPIVCSQSNHRYDTSDYEKVDPYAGNWDDLESLCQEAHKRGMKVIIDAVFNHTGNDSKYFNEYGTFPEEGAYQNANSKYAKFYKKRKNGDNVQFEYWWGFHNLPECNGNSEEWLHYITGEGGIIDQWFSRGIDGLRLDVADELTDYFIEQIRVAVKRNKKDGFILGEVWKNPMRMYRSYIESGKGMDSVMNYPLVDALIRYFKYADTHKLSYILDDILTEYPEDTIYSLMNFTSTHDISRAIHLFSKNEFCENKEWVWDVLNEDRDYQKHYHMNSLEYEELKKIYKAYLFALTFLPGNLSIFYGDEVGCQGLGNLSNRCPFPWDQMDQELLKYFQSIGDIRRKEPFLEKAKLKILHINPYYFSFKRILNDEEMLVCVNRTDKKGFMYIPPEFKNPQLSYHIHHSKDGYLDPYGGFALKKKINNSDKMKLE